MNGMLNQEREAGIGNGREPIKKCLYSVVFQIWPVESASRYDLWAPMSQLWANYEPIFCREFFDIPYIWAFYAVLSSTGRATLMTEGKITREPGLTRRNRT